MGFHSGNLDINTSTLRLQLIPRGQAPPRVKPKPMYVIFHVEFNGIVRNIDFRRDITKKISKKDGTIFCLILVQHRRRNNFDFRSF